MSTQNVWKFLEFVIAVHKAVDKVDIDTFNSLEDETSPLLELYRNYKKCIEEIEGALFEVLLCGLAVDEIRLHMRKEDEFFEMLMGNSNDLDE